jgi:pimeloyl-ACP methyl ester carboxylesterase
LNNQRSIDIGKRKLTLVESGMGFPTVILETGLGVEAESWAEVQSGVAAFSKVIRYDRAGRGSSDPDAGPRSAGRMVENLHRLLDKAQIPGPYVLVGQSFGGIIVRLFAARHPEQTAGLVLVDPTHEDQFELIAAALPEPAPADQQAMSDFRQFWSRDYRDPQKNREGIDFLSSFSEIRAEEHKLTVPVRILSGSALLPELTGHPAEAENCREIWWRLHDQLISLSEDSLHMRVENSGHFIQCDQPAAVVKAIREVVTQVRRHDS